MAMQVSDWRTGRKVAECVEYLGDKKIFTDVTFVFPNDGGKKCTGHKLILSMRSAVFEAMFYRTMAETSDTITIEDIGATTFEQMVRFMYTDTIDLDGDNVLKCLFAAKKYCLDDLIVCCKLFLEESIATDNVCSIYEQVKFFDEEDLREKCWIYVFSNAGEIFKGNDVVKLDKESLTALLSDGGLPTSELENFQAVLRWSDEECIKREIEATPENKRIVLEGILEKIRFPLMTLTEFAEHVTPSKVLSDRTMLDLFQFLVTRKSRTPGHVGQYHSLPRKAALSDKYLDLSDLASMSLLSYQKKNECTIVIECTHDINISALNTCQQYNFKSVVITNIENDEKITHLLSLEECVKDDLNGEFRIIPTLLIPRTTKSAITFKVKPETKTRMVQSYNYYYGCNTTVKQTYTDDVSAMHREINFKYESGEFIIVISEIPTALSGLRYTVCMDETDKKVATAEC